jgi:molybdopterin-guanine dinucleotide biosynthesis protein A
VLPRKFKVIEDEFLGAGHLGGLHSGLKAASNSWVAIAPSEAPLSSPRLYELLLKAARGHDGATPLQCGKKEPMHGVYRRRELLKAVEAEMLHGAGGLSEAVRSLRLKELGPRRVESADKEKRTFWRLESAEAIRAVEGMLK